MHARSRLIPALLLFDAAFALAQPYDFAAADALLDAELADMNGHVAVIVRQDGVELYRYQAGDIGYDTKTRLASFTKTVSACVVLAVRDEGLISLNDRLGDSFPLFEQSGIGNPTVLDAWGMRHGIQSPIAYEHDSRFTLAESVTRIGLTGFSVFSPGTMLGYDGAGMQAVGRMAELRAGASWEAVARDRILDPCGMPQADYAQFAPNPSVPGGLRSTATEGMNFAQMIIDRGWFAGQRVLSDESIEQLFTNATRGLAVYASPWPATHPLYPNGTEPDYAFGGWVLAEDAAADHVEEIVGAGAWGSFVWLDRRRGLSAVLITDVPAGSQASMDAALGLFAIARQQVESAQVHRLEAIEWDAEVCLTWEPAAGSIATRLYGSAAPIRDVYELRGATQLGEFEGGLAVATGFAYYAATAVFDGLENSALTSRGNATALPPVRPDLDGDGVVDLGDYEILADDLGNPGPAASGDVDRDGDADLADYAVLQRQLGTPGC